MPTPAAIMTTIQDRALGLCLDTGHYLYGGGDPVELVKRHGDRMSCLHLKDIDEKKVDVPWGMGNVDAKGIMEALAAQHPTNKPVFFIEYETSHGTDLANNVGKCCENFSKYCEEMTK